MTKHVHDPYVASDGNVYCEECTEWLGDDAYATHRIKATSRLSAEDARVIADKHEGKTKEILRAYADILESE